MERSAYRSPFSRRHFWKWFLLAFISGSVNAGGFLACSMFVSHVTGFATLFGVDLAHWNLSKALAMISVPFFFLLGSIISALLVDRRLHRGKRPFYSTVMGLVSLCLLLVVCGGALNHFGRFGMHFEVSHDYSLIALLCLASGLQNAVITTASGNLIRTTHLTGITTDLGLGIVRVIFRQGDEERHLKEVKQNWLRIGTITSFIAGSSVGASFYLRFGYWGFILPASLSMVASLTVLRRTKDHPHPLSSGFE